MRETGVLEFQGMVIVWGYGRLLEVGGRGLTKELCLRWEMIEG